MPITAGDVRATMTLDTSKFSDGIAQAKTELSTIEADGTKVTNAFANVESRIGASAASIAAAMQAAGNGSNELMLLAGRAEQAVAKVDTLGTSLRAAEATLQTAMSAADQSAAALTLLQDSASAAADNLVFAQEALQALAESGEATEVELREAANAVAECEQDIAELSRAIEAQTVVYESNAAAAQKATDKYRQLSAQLLSAEAKAESANIKFAALTNTLNADGMSLAGIVDTIGSLGASTLTSASRSLASMAVHAAGLGKSTAAGNLASAGMSQVLKVLTSALGATTMGYAGLAGAALYAGYKIIQSSAQTKSGVDVWEKAYAKLDTKRTTTLVNTINADLKLETTGLSDKVKSVYDEIATALTDGEPDTEGIISKLTEKTSTMFSEVRTQIQTWYDTEMSNLDLSTSAGLTKAAELAEEYNTLMTRVNELDTSTATFIASYTGKTTAECLAALTQLKTVEEEVAQITERIEQANALLHSNEKAAYTAVTAGLTADETSVGNALQYVKFNYAIEFNNAAEDHEDALAKISQEAQEALNNATSEEEKVKIQQKYELEFQAETESYEQTKAQLQAQYDQMMQDVFQSVAATLAKSDPKLQEALFKGARGETFNFQDFEVDSESLETLVKAAVETGMLDGMEGVDLTTAEGQLQALFQLLNLGQHGETDLAFNNLTTYSELLGGLVSTSAHNAGEKISETAAEIDKLNQTADGGGVSSVKGSFLDAFLPDADGVDRIAQLGGFIAQLYADAEAGDLNTLELQAYGQTMQDLFTIMSEMNPDFAGDYEFLTRLSEKVNESGFMTTAETVLEVLQQLWEAGGKKPIDLEIKTNESGVPVPTIEQLETLGYGDPQKVVIEAEIPDISDSIGQFDELNTKISELGADAEGMDLSALFETPTDFATFSANLTTFLGSVYETLEQGGEIGPEVQAQLAAVLDFVGGLNTAGVGTDLMGGVSSGMEAYGFQSSASNVATSLEFALRAACQTHSPSEMTKPIGTDLTDGIAKGMEDIASIGASAAVVATTAEAALASAFAGIDCSAYGQAAAQSYADAVSNYDGAGAGAALASTTAAALDISSEFASAGNNAGSAFVTAVRSWAPAAASAATAIGSAAYNALKASLEIHSPSRKAEFAGNMFGEGFTMGIADEIARTQAGVISLAGAATQTLNGQATAGGMRSNSLVINLNGATIRSENDIRKLSRQLGAYINNANFGIS